MRAHVCRLSPKPNIELLLTRTRPPETCPQIHRSALKSFWIVSEFSDSEIALRTEDPPDIPCFVAVVDVHPVMSLVSGVQPSTNSAAPSLIREDAIVVGDADPVLPESLTESFCWVFLLPLFRFFSALGPELSVFGVKLSAPGVDAILLLPGALIFPLMLGVIFCEVSLALSFVFPSVLDRRSEPLGSVFPVILALIIFAHALGPSTRMSQRLSSMW